MGESYRKTTPDFKAELRAITPSSDSCLRRTIAGVTLTNGLAECRRGSFYRVERGGVYP